MADDIIMHMLRNNLGYKDGERVLVVQQTHNNPPASEKPRFDSMNDVNQALLSALKNAGIDVEHITYQPTSLMNGADANKEAYKQLKKLGIFDIVILATVYSLTHTNFRKTLTDTGARVASIPGFKKAFFEHGGPLDVNYQEIITRNNNIKAQLRAATHVRIKAPGTEVTAEIDHNLIQDTTGQFLKPGAYGNIPGAEVYFPPVHRGNTHGYFTIPRGWGGPMTMPCDVQFTITQGAFTNVEATEPAYQNWVEEHIKPILFGDNNYEVVAEIGIGTNHAITPASIEQYGFSILLAEKIYRTAHIANGNSKGMGGINDVPVHVDWVIPEATLTYEKHS